LGLQSVMSGDTVTIPVAELVTAFDKYVSDRDKRDRLIKQSAGEALLYVYDNVRRVTGSRCDFKELDKSHHCSGDYEAIAMQMCDSLRLQTDSPFYDKMLEAVVGHRKHPPYELRKHVDVLLMRYKACYERAFIKELILCTRESDDVVHLLFDAWKKVEQCEKGRISTIVNSEKQTKSDKGKVNSVLVRHGEDFLLYHLTSTGFTYRDIKEPLDQKKFFYVFIASPCAPFKITSRCPGLFESTVEAVSFSGGIDLLSGPLARKVLQRFVFPHDPKKETVYRVDPRALGPGRYYCNTVIHGEERDLKIFVGNSDDPPSLERDVWGIEDTSQVPKMRKSLKSLWDNYVEDRSG